MLNLIREAYQRWKLRPYNDTNVPLLGFSGKVVVAKVVKVYDGDTVRLVFRWRGKVTKVRCRLEGYDAAELKPPKSMPGRDREVQLAQLARVRLCHLVGLEACDGMVKAHLGEMDKYGRVLATLYNQKGDCVNTHMLQSGLVVAYSGGTRSHAEKNDLPIQ